MASGFRASPPFTPPLIWNIRHLHQSGISVYIGNIGYGEGVMNTTERFKGLNKHLYSRLYTATYARNNLRSVQLGVILIGL